ncbi:MAG: family 20 glycosylhydrolase [Bacteroidetes bacterium]|nr:family 20 glycosylhydrolase [Bacteroidota bacterium]
MTSIAQTNLDSIMPVRGFSIDAPRPSGLDSFIRFINEELAPRKVNTLLVLVDYHYQFKSHPELTDSFALSKKDVKKIAEACRKNNIKVIPQINLLGHQSWANKTGKLLQAYPEFDETPYIIIPAKYEWPNADNLYCKSYCPLYPGLHKILFDVIDELCDAFETDTFQGGMDEVFFIGEDKCPRCAGRDKSELFADEVRRIRDHLAEKNRALWIWGDRLIDGKTTGLGIWEASYNNTYRAIDMIPKDVVICDWHYERADKTAPYFSVKGFKVITCPWRDPFAAVSQVNDMAAFRKESTPEMKERFLGVMETTWMRADFFLKGYYESLQKNEPFSHTAWGCFRKMYEHINKLE